MNTIHTTLGAPPVAGSGRARHRMASFLGATLLSSVIFAIAARAHEHSASENYSVLFPTGPLGGSIITITGIGPPGGSSILHTVVALKFQAQGTPASNVKISVEAMVDGGTKEIVVSGQMLGFPAQMHGIFTGSFDTDALNGLVQGFGGFGGSSILDIHVYAEPGGGIQGSILDGKVTVVANSSLMADTPSISLATGGTQALKLNASATYAGATYLLLGSVSGTAPGVAVPGGLLPLNLDAWFQFTLANPNNALLSNGLGTLDAQGSAQAAFALPPIADASLVGLVVHHAFAVLDASNQKVVFVSIPVGVTLDA